MLLWSSRTRYRSSAKLNWKVFGALWVVVYPPTHIVRNVANNFRVTGVRAKLERESLDGLLTHGGGAQSET